MQLTQVTSRCGLTLDERLICPYDRLGSFTSDGSLFQIRGAECRYGKTFCRRQKYYMSCAADDKCLSVSRTHCLSA